VLLPGSNADVDPSRFKQERSLRTAAPDARRDEVDDLLLDDAYAHRKPVLGICYGLQSLNVHQKGSLIQHIPDFLPEATRTRVDHEAGKTVTVAHTVAIDRGSLLAGVIGGDGQQKPPGGGQFGDSGGILGKPENQDGALVIPVNSSHHQSADAIGDGLLIVARCAEDGIIEALEGTSPDHFVLAVQWHPERSVEADEPSAAIFRALIEAAR
jgi:putative glutamine amidotransferase